MCRKAVLAELVLLLVESWTLCTVTSSSMLSGNYTDRLSLVAFKSAIEFAPDNVLAKNWTENTNFCNWYGVTCSKRRQRVTVLYLRSMGLVGPISPHVGNLSFLRVLDLANNSFHGQVINELGSLRRLTVLNLGPIKLRGEIPMSLTLCLNLKRIDMEDNGLTDVLPKNLSALTQLQELYLGRNNLTGTIPTSIGNMSTLQGLALEENKFHGIILKEMALLPRLIELSLGENYLTGAIPPSLFNISSLEVLSLSVNLLTGYVPDDTSLQLPNLTKLLLGGNQLTGSIPSHCYNASTLTLLAIENNNFTGILPESLPLSLRFLSAHHSNIEGEIPRGIGVLKNLTYLALNGNRFTGAIPPAIGGMKSLQVLYLDDNQLEGPIPKEICYLKNLGELLIGINRFSGSIPECIGNISGLQELSLDFNRLSLTIPESLWSLESLVYLGLSSNLLYGDLGRNFATMKSLNTLDLSQNQLSGNIPDFLESSQSLTILDLSWNSFTGPVPESFGKLISLVSMNLSNNNLSGQIPKSWEALRYLKHLNLSYNNLSGEIPSRGPFMNFTAQSFIGNRELCGEYILKPCPSQGLRKMRNKWFPLSYIVPIIVFVAVVGALFYVSCKRRKNSLHRNQEKSFQEHTLISYHELSHATNGFSEANLLGSGGFGCVYKGILSDGKIVAVKLLNLTIDGAIKSFDAECKVLRTVRHRNLVKVISTCTNPELRALVLEYMPKGSLEKWLYSHNYCLSFLQRVNIMLGVAIAMDYLHCGQSEPVIHCDLKPSNVLLDEDMVAHVADFGIAKILAANKTETQTNTLGTFGYIASEYGTEGRVSIKGDTLSYGILLLETFTRKKPTDEMFSGELSFRQWVSSSVSNSTTDVVDENLLKADAQDSSTRSSQSNLLAILKIGLGCSRDLPEDRFEMKDVLTKLNKIKLQFLSE